MKLKYHRFVYTVLVTAGFLTSPVQAMDKYSSSFEDYEKKETVLWNYTHQVTGNTATSAGHILRDGYGNSITQSQAEGMAIKCLVVSNPFPYVEGQSKTLRQVEQDGKPLCRFIEDKKPETVEFPYVNNNAILFLKACRKAGVKNLTVKKQTLDKNEWEEGMKNKKLKGLHVQNFDISPADLLQNFDPKILNSRVHFSYSGGIPSGTKTERVIRSLEAQAAQCRGKQLVDEVDLMPAEVKFSGFKLAQDDNVEAGFDEVGEVNF